MEILKGQVNFWLIPESKTKNAGHKSYNDPLKLAILPWHSGMSALASPVQSESPVYCHFYYWAVLLIFNDHIVPMSKNQKRHYR